MLFLEPFCFYILNSVKTLWLRHTGFKIELTTFTPKAYTVFTHSFAPNITLKLFKMSKLFSSCLLSVSVSRKSITGITNASLKNLPCRIWNYSTQPNFTGALRFQGNSRPWTPHLLANFWTVIEQFKKELFWLKGMYYFDSVFLTLFTTS